MNASSDAEGRLKPRHDGCVGQPEMGSSAARARDTEAPRLTTVGPPAVAAERRMAALQFGGRGWRALRYSNYRLYFFGQVVSQSGTWLQRIAQSWLVLDLANSPAALGVLTVFQFTPALLLSLVAGVVADRVGKQRLIMITSALETVQALALAAITLSG